MKIYTLICSVMNGTVTMSKEVTGYSTKELAEETKAAVDKANEDPNSPFGVWTEIQEMEIYTDRSEVPILNKKENY